LIQTDAPEVNRQTIEVDAIGAHTEKLDPEVRAQNIQEVVGKVNKRLDHFESTHFSFLQIGRAQKFTDDFVPLEENAFDMNRQLLGGALARFGLGVDVVHTHGGLAVTAQGSSDGKGASSSDKSTSHQGGGLIAADARERSQQPAEALASLRLYRGDAVFTSRPFIFPFKQVAVALVALVFAAPIYTRPIQGRVVGGALVMLQERASELHEYQQVLEVELAALPQVR
jgi:hypothetical protein